MISSISDVANINCRLCLQTSMDKSKGKKGLSEKCELTLHNLVREVQVRQSAYLQLRHPTGNNLVI